MIVTSRDCEIVKQLIALYCSSGLERIDISVEECLDLFAKMVLASQKEEITFYSDSGVISLSVEPERERERERDAGTGGCGR